MSSALMRDDERIIGTACDAIVAPDEGARDAARRLQRSLTKPAGSLGRLEELHVWAAGVLRDPAPALERTLIVVAAADHGVAEEGVSAYPADVTAQMVRNFLAGGAAVSVLAAHTGSAVIVVDAGVRTDVADARLRVEKVRRGAANIARGPAMTRDETARLVRQGIELAREAGADGVRAIGLGDMGIGNTTPAAAITSAFTGAPPRATAGRGTGIDDEAFAAKVAAIQRALAVSAPDPLDPLGTLATVGGCELAFLAGVAVGAASERVAVVLDGYPTTAAALVAAAMAPQAVEYMLAAHRSAEPGHAIALDHLDLRPLLDLEMRLGEGTGAALAISLLRAALRLPREMATFDSAGVSRGHAEVPPEN